MAKIRKCKLCWEASASENVVGYKLYWSRGTEVGYDSKYIKIGNATEIILPDDVIFSDDPVMFGVTAVDRDGNESDMVTIDQPYRMQVPEAPTGLLVEPSDEFTLFQTGQPKNEKLQLVDSKNQDSGEEDPLAEAIENGGAVQVAKLESLGDSENDRPM
ncbi:hypothetical protein DSCW_49640 [Desulfosarcina widdelii]|uniref:Uncharacterized protein n=1 Tax=Desulfosarcina widdelii TaxID=947919 RepID=A0A5K7ZN25_9BACT|nr:hypothetical protein [Desulfosarcina widdelii]BBO77547.1 hypothetical protein DSCW_49640 [Desulfosarcina widdelii]